jgi:hypothetical protein
VIGEVGAGAVLSGLLVGVVDRDALARRLTRTTTLLALALLRCRLLR